MRSRRMRFHATCRFAGGFVLLGLLGLLVLSLAACAGRTARPEEDLAASDGTRTEARSGEAVSPDSAASPEIRHPEAQGVSSDNTASPETRSSEAASPDSAAGADELDDYPEAPPPVIADPLEGWNRFWFAFNDVLYTHVFRPLFRAYEFITPAGLRAGLKNVLKNLEFPARFINSILQGKFLAAGVEYDRFLVNSILGLGGFFNVTRDNKTIVPVDEEGEDFGQTLGVWGFGPGIYLVWPLLGPSTVRDTVGMAGDYLTDPLLFVPGTTSTTDTVSLVVWSGLRVNAAGDTLDRYEGLKKMAVDPYSSMRDMYVKSRKGRIER